MATITIPKNFISNDDLIIISELQNPQTPLLNNQPKIT